MPLAKVAKIDQTCVWGFVSIVFAIILGLYAALRTGFWLRGQLRLRSGLQALPALPPARDPPTHLRPELARFFEHCLRVKCELAAQRRQIATAKLSDPDQYFGFLRDPRYRRAVLEAAGSLRAWLGHTEVFFGLHHRRQCTWPVSPECAQSTLLAIEPQLRSAIRSRALEPFDLTDVDHIDRALLSFVAKVDLTLESLTQDQGVSYRNPPQTPVLARSSSEPLGQLSNQLG